MSADLNRARALLESQGYTCVLVGGDHVYTSNDRGVKPLLAWLSQGVCVKGFCAADKVVGKATAFLYCLLGIRAVYTPVISHSAAQVLRDHGIELTAGVEVDFIWNRRRTAPCPMETAVKDIQNPDDALTAIRETLKTL